MIVVFCVIPRPPVGPPVAPLAKLNFLVGLRMGSFLPDQGLMWFYICAPEPVYSVAGHKFNIRLYDEANKWGMQCHVTQLTCFSVKFGREFFVVQRLSEWKEV